MGVRIGRSSGQQRPEGDDQWECSFGYMHKMDQHCCHSSHNPDTPDEEQPRTD
jgi:hypothetical protein